jgi:DDE family transposase
VLHARLRKGSSQRGANRFIEELIARVRRAGATGTLVLRADSGFWSYKLIDTPDRLRVGWSITININPSIRACIDALDSDAWTPIDYPDSGQAAVAETTYTTGRGAQQRLLRLVVRRSRLVDPAQTQLWPDWRYHAFITNLDPPTVEVDQFHRDHATIELAIRDLKDGAGLEHCPSGKFFANAAWLACAVLAHNLIRWTARIGTIHPEDQLTVARTVRTRLLALPGRVVNRSGRHTLRLPARWP